MRAQEDLRGGRVEEVRGRRRVRERAAEERPGVREPHPRRLRQREGGVRVTRLPVPSYSRERTVQPCWGGMDWEDVPRNDIIRFIRMEHKKPT